MAQYLIANGITPTSSAAFTAVATGTGLKTMLQVKPSATATMRVIEWGCSFDGSAAATPGKVELIETDVAATVTASVTGDITKYDAAALMGGDPVTNLIPVGTTSTGYTASAEGSIAVTRYLDGPQFIAPTTQYQKQFPLGQQPLVQISKFLRVRVIFGTTVNCFCYVIVEV